MKYLIRKPADIVENLNELARENGMLYYTLERLVLLPPSYRQDVLNKLRRTKKGRPNRSVQRRWFFADLERSIQEYRPEVEAALEKKRVSEKDVIVWMFNQNWIGPGQDDQFTIRNSMLDSTAAKRYIKFIQDGLSDYRLARRSKHPSPKTP